MSAVAPETGQRPTWATRRQAQKIVCEPSHLRHTTTIALIVGTILFAINQLDAVLRGEATAVVWVKSAVTYLVPFCVANAGVLVATRGRPSDRHAPPDRS